MDITNTATTGMAMSMGNNKYWTDIISPKHRWFDIDLGALWRYRDLCFMYVKQTFITQYKQTILGPLWFFIQPIMSIIIYMFIFGGLAGISTEGVPQPLFYMAGILLWNYFNDCFNASCNVFVNHRNLFEKVWFPRLIMPVSGSISGLLKLGIQFILFIFIYIGCLFVNDTLHLTWVILLLPIFLLMIALHGMSWGLIVSSVTYKYRDLQVLIGFILQLFMYLTPVVYPLETIPEKYKIIVSLNPLSSIFETFKYGCFGHGIADWWGLFYSLVFLLVILTLSLMIFSRAERNFIDTV